MKKESNWKRNLRNKVKLGILLNLGESLTTLKASGQDRRMLDYYWKNYRQAFDQVYLFSYQQEKYPLPGKVILFGNRNRLHRFLYTFLLPFFYAQEFKDCDVFRVMHLLGSLPAIIAKIFYTKRYVVTYGYDYKKFSQIEGKGYLRPLISLIEFLNFKLADGFIAANKQIKVDLLKKVGKEKVFYIPNGVDIKKFKMKSEKLKKVIPSEWKIKNSKLKEILFVGRLERQKNLFTLIKAVSLLKNRKEVVLKFVGGGSLRKSLTRYAKKQGVSLSIIKKIPYGKMPTVYQGADIFVLPSIAEGNPKALLEAMASGLVCIANDIPTISNLIKNKKTGLLFKNDAQDLKRNLKQVLGNPKLAIRLGEEARRFIVEKRDFQKLITKEIKILKTLG